MGDAYHVEVPRVLHGRYVQVSWCYDHDMGAPWEEHDGHGPVRKSNGRHRKHDDKQPGERPLNAPNRHGYQYYYDWELAIKQAKRDGWGDHIDAFMHLTASHRRVPTKGMIAEYAVEQDFQRLRDWIDEKWHWCGIVATDLETEVDASLWGIESDSDAEFIDECVSDLANEMWPQVLRALLQGDAARQRSGSLTPRRAATRWRSGRSSVACARCVMGGSSLSARGITCSAGPTSTPVGRRWSSTFRRTWRPGLTPTSTIKRGPSMSGSGCKIVLGLE